MMSEVIYSESLILTANCQNIIKFYITRDQVALAHLIHASHT